MIAILIECCVIGIWATVLTVHVRRLFRLAHVQALPSGRFAYVRGRLKRVWWWLGREEYWRGMLRDGAQSVQLTLMIFLFAWGAAL